MTTISYRYCHFPPDVIQHAVWLCYRFTSSFRDEEDMPAGRGVEVSYETIRRWVARFGPQIARHLRRHRPVAHPQWHLDEMFVWLCHKLDCVTDYAQRSIPSGSGAGSGAPCRESLITTVSMFGG